jgi:beta-glucosidase
MKIRVLLSALLTMILALPLISQPLPSDKKIEDLISKMTLEEKIDFIGGYKEFNIRGYERLGIPEIHMADGPLGVRNFGKSTAYPAGINLAASWDKKLAYNVGKAIACEARSKNAHIILGPAVNIYRMPLCGRNFEYLGEDPYLAGHIAKEYIVGMQDQGVIACVKHYAANNQEFNRHTCSSDMDERTLHEIYLPAFKTSVQEGKVGAVMTSYNLMNGIHTSENNYLNKCPIGFQHTMD